MRNKKLDRKFYLKVACCDQTHASVQYYLFLFIIRLIFFCLHKAHILFSSEILYLRLRNASQVMDAASS